MKIKSNELVENWGWCFSTNLLKWVARNSKQLNEKFAKKFPMALNLFHIQILDNKGTKRTLIWKQYGEVDVSMTNSYHNTIPWSVIRKMGAPN